MSLDKRRHDGRLKDPWQVPHGNRKVYVVWFWFIDGTRIGVRCAVPEPIEANLKKYKSQVIEANRADWMRPKYKRVVLGIKDGKEIAEYSPDIDPKTGQQRLENRLVKVTADFIGGDR